MILVANPFQHLFHLANNRLGGHNLNLTTKAKYPAKELWADSNRDFYFKMLIINLTILQGIWNKLPTLNASKRNRSGLPHS